MAAASRTCWDASGDTAFAARAEVPRPATRRSIMSVVRRALTVVALGAVLSLGLGGTSHASDQCEWWFDGAPAFYCQQI
ncbi:hypothetical protein GCM10010371_01810 [Streptomyces subrutilus]|uniref:Uncharacterized protein n=1 Tax=Streptomyces subrutilus TaxID=36818 RepID=A0A918QHT3_9ACTN|nr:hypothetical protein GCM10010371_01810 [Streptomyces subrutilus]